MVPVTHPSSRRAPGPPTASTGELVRRRLLDAVGRRFDVPITVIMAGAGFGKSTLLAQAIRVNQAEPCGIDAWLSCEAGDGDASTLADAIASSLDYQGDRRDPLEHVLEAFGRHAPIDVCLILDDLHEIPPSTTGADLLVRLAAELPPHAHLALAGRDPTSIPLARRRAAEQVVDIGAEDLAFTSTETAALAREVGTGDGTGRLDALGGWPSLVRLALSAPDGSAPQFLWEEVVATLTHDERRHLGGLATLGWGTTADVQAVSGGAAPDLSALAARVPLVRCHEHGRYVVHQLWENAVDRIFAPDELSELRRRSLAMFHTRGETLRAGWSALRWGDDDALGQAARSLVRDTFGALPIDTAMRWLREAGPFASASADLRLLALASEHARDYDAHHDVGRRLDEQIDELTDRYLADDDQPGAGVALALAAVVAHEHGDLGRLYAIDARARSELTASDDPVLRFLAGALPAGLASLEGDVHGALGLLADLSHDKVPSAMTEVIVRLEVSMLRLAGRSAEAVPMAEVLLDAPTAYVRTIPAHVRWSAGDPSGFSGASVLVDPGPGTNERYRFIHAALVTHVAAALGDRAALEEFRITIEKFATTDITDPRDRALISSATATRNIAEHDEGAAVLAIRDHVDARTGDDSLADVHLRSVPAVPFVLDDRVRERWAHESIGPSLTAQVEVAKLFLAARAGSLAVSSRLPSAAALITSLPLPWSVELVARAVGARCQGATALAQGLSRFAPLAVRRELEHAVDHSATLTGDSVSAFRSGAEALLELLVDPLHPTVRVDVLGPLRVRIGDDTVSAPELRRGRVRTLIELLALIGPVRRERLIDLMWPDLDAAAGGRNLRVTLTRVRDVLEPGRRSGSTCSALCFNQDTVALAAAPLVEVDLIEFRRDLAEADAADRRGDPSMVIAALQRACERWRGEPLGDVEQVTDLADDIAVLSAVTDVRHLLADTALRLGEVHLVAGRFEEAVRSAERVIAESPYTERAHRLVIASHLQRRDPGAAERSIVNVRAMLADLGVDAEPSTQMLIRQVTSRRALTVAR